MKTFIKATAYTMFWSIVSMTFIALCVGLISLVMWALLCLPTNLVPVVIVVVAVLVIVASFAYDKYYRQPRFRKIELERGWKDTDDPDWMMR